MWWFLVEQTLKGGGWDRGQKDLKGTPRDRHQSGEMNTREGPGGA